MQPAVVCLKTERRADVARGRAYVPVSQRHNLGAGGRAGSMQDQRDVVVLRDSAVYAWRACMCRVRDSETARAILGMGRQFQNRDIQFRGDFPRGRIAPFCDNQRLGFQIEQIELELVGTIRHVQRCRRAAAGDRNKRGGHLGTIGQHDPDPVPPAHAKPVEGVHGLLHKTIQSLVSQRLCGRCSDRNCGRCALCMDRDHFRDRGKFFHDCPVSVGMDRVAN